ncbi:hypothetical protein [Staphylococcus phage vB_SsapH-Golestan-100]|nr:hypothetical protein [Staphylococcus phage vB_SsapH-Golestan-100]
MKNLKTNTNLEAFTKAYSDKADTRYLVNRFNLSDEVENTTDAFIEMTQEQITEAIKDTFIVNYFGTFLYIDNDVKRDVANYLLEMSQDSEDAEGLLDDIVSHGCESGMVNHLIYYKDTKAYYEEHEEEIKNFVTEVYGIEELESWDGIQDLSDMFPVDSADDRHQEAEEKIREIAQDNVIDYYGDDWDDMDDIEQEEAIELEAESICMYEADPLELTTQDKNYLAWAIFEYEARMLQDELEEIDTEEEEEPLTVGEAIDMIEEEQAEDVLSQQDDSVQVLYDLQALGYAGAIMDDFGVSVGITDVRAVTPVSTALNTEYGTITLFKSKRYFREAQQEVNKNYYLVDGHTIVETDYMFIIIKDGEIIDQINR